MGSRSIGMSRRGVLVVERVEEASSTLSRFSTAALYRILEELQSPTSRDDKTTRIPEDNNIIHVVACMLIIRQRILVVVSTNETVLNRYREP